MAEPVNFRVIGIGEFGKNAINKMKDSDLKGVEYSVIDDNSNPNILKGNIVMALPVPTDMVFVVANTEETDMNIASMVTETTKEMDVLSVVFVVKSSSSDNADEKTERIKESADSVIVVSEDEFVNESLLQRIKSITDTINIPGLINVEFTDVERILKNSGLAQMGFGHTLGEEKEIKATKMALNSVPDINNAGGVIVNIAGNQNMTLYEVSNIVNEISNATEGNSQIQIIFGTVIDESLQDEIKVTLIATGLDNEKQVV